MLNRITIAGRITKDLELKKTSYGTSVTSFSVAVERDFKSQNGERETDFFNVVAWRSTAEMICKYFAKGRMIIIDGKLQTRSWTDNNGNKRTSVDIIAESVYFGDSKKDASPSYSVPSYNESSTNFEEIDDEQGELPF